MKSIKSERSVEKRKHLHDERRLTVHNTIVSLIDMDSREARDTWADPSVILTSCNLEFDLSQLARPTGYSYFGRFLSFVYCGNQRICHRDHHHHLAFFRCFNSAAALVIAGVFLCLSRTHMWETPDMMSASEGGGGSWKS